MKTQEPSRQLSFSSYRLGTNDRLAKWFPRDLARLIGDVAGGFNFKKLVRGWVEGATSESNNPHETTASVTLVSAGSLYTRGYYLSHARSMGRGRW